jgi:YfiH family protein
VRRITYRTLVYYQFESFLGYGGLTHGVFSRLGGHSRPPWDALNTGHTVGDDPAHVKANHQLICESLGICRQDLVSPHQVHSTAVHVVGKDERGQVCPETDALVTATPGVVLMLRFADCVPIVLYDPARRVVGLAHAGWRGTVGGIAGRTVHTMVSDLGCCPENILAGVGPSIGPCCYEIGQDVADAVSGVFPGPDDLLERKSNGRWHLDLWAANRRQLADAGVQTIEIAGMCTACHTGEWFSHRAEDGKTGRLGVLVGLREGAEAR